MRQDQRTVGCSPIRHRSARLTGGHRASPLDAQHHHRPARSLARPVSLAVHSHRRVLHGGAGVRRAVRAAARAPVARRCDDADRRAARAAAAGRAVLARRRHRHDSSGHHRRRHGFALQLIFDALAMGGQLLVQLDGPGLRVQRRSVARREHAGARAALHAAGHADVPRAERPSHADRNAGAGLHDAAGRHDGLRRRRRCGMSRAGARSCSPARSRSRCPA